MISLRQLIESVVLGLLWIAFGLVPGLMETLVAGVYTLAAKLAPGFPVPRRQSIDRPGWFAVVGGAITFLSMFAYLLAGG